MSLPVFEHKRKGGLYEVLTREGKLRLGSGDWAGPYVFYRSLRDGQYYARRPENFASDFVEFKG